MNGYVAVTDFGWYERLSRELEPQDANFWRPSVRPVHLAVGTPFFFKLKAPHHRIAGYGFFAGFSILPDWLAWETFGEANGVGTLDELRGRLARIQRGAAIAPDPQGRIGCSLIAEARFFPPEHWVRPPSDWRARTVSGAGYDLRQGEGMRIWHECRERTALHGAAIAESAAVGARYGEPVLTRPRLGQGIFRVHVLDAYDRACAVTREHSLPVLEAAHIRSYACGGAHEVSNGLTLRTDLHRLFDSGYATLDEDNCFQVSDRLRADFGNGRSYDELRGRRIVLPSDERLHPAPDALAWHRRERFLG